MVLACKVGYDFAQLPAMEDSQAVTVRLHRLVVETVAAVDGAFLAEQLAAGFTVWLNYPKAVEHAEERARPRGANERSRSPQLFSGLL